MDMDNIVKQFLSTMKNFVNKVVPQMTQNCLRTTLGQIIKAETDTTATVRIVGSPPDGSEDLEGIRTPVGYQENDTVLLAYTDNKLTNLFVLMNLGNSSTSGSTTPTGLGVEPLFESEKGEISKVTINKTLKDLENQYSFIGIDYGLLGGSQVLETKLIPIKSFVDTEKNDIELDYANFLEIIYAISPTLWVVTESKNTVDITLKTIQTTVALSDGMEVTFQEKPENNGVGIFRVFGVPKK